jgi:FHA domain
MSTRLVPILRVSDLPADGSMSHWVLVGQVPHEDHGDPRSHRSGAGATARAVRVSAGDLDLIIDESWSAWSLLKRPGQSSSSDMLLGRAPTNDISIAHSSVSKLHARIRVEGVELVMSDASSSNGTVVNGESVRAGDEVPLVSGDFVRFGACVFQVFSPSHINAIVTRLRGVSPV